jgi:hypothetical protein
MNPALPHDSSRTARHTAEAESRRASRKRKQREHFETVLSPDDGMKGSYYKICILSSTLISQQITVPDYLLSYHSFSLTFLANKEIET